MKTKTKTKSTKSNNMGKAVAIGAGVVALAAAGYFFLGPRGKKHIAQTRGWMIKMKGDVVEKLETMHDVTKDAYDAVVDTVASAYTAMGGKEEVMRFSKELKSHWKAISKKAAVKAKKSGKKIKKSNARKLKTKK